MTLASIRATGACTRSWCGCRSDPIRYERRLAGGGVEVFAQADAAPAGQRRVFLTEVRDAQGQAVTLTYDAQYRLVALTDALGQVTTLSYDDAADPLRLTGVTDPFGRRASFTYTATGQLETLTDTLGLTSRLVYGSEDQVLLLTTPYGTTSFRHGGDFYNPTIEATDALGGTERVEYRWETTAWGASEAAETVPCGVCRGERAAEPVHLGGLGRRGVGGGAGLRGHGDADAVAAGHVGGWGAAAGGAGAAQREAAAGAAGVVCLCRPDGRGRHRHGVAAVGDGARLGRRARCSRPRRRTTRPGR